MSFFSKKKKSSLLSKLNKTSTSLPNIEKKLSSPRSMDVSTSRASLRPIELPKGVERQYSFMGASSSGFFDGVAFNPVSDDEDTVSDNNFSLADLLARPADQPPPEYHAEMIPDVIYNLNLRTSRLPYLADVIDQMVHDSKISCIDQRKQMEVLESRYQQLHDEHLKLQQEVFAQLDEKITMAENFSVLITQLTQQLNRASQNIRRRSVTSDPAQLMILMNCLRAFDKASAASETLHLERTALELKLQMVQHEHSLLQERMKQIKTLQNDIVNKFSSINERHQLLQTLIDNTTALSSMLDGEDELSPTDGMIQAITPDYSQNSVETSPLYWKPMSLAMRGFPPTIIEDLSVFISSNQPLSPPSSMKHATISQLMIHLSERTEATFQRQFLQTFPYFLSPTALLHLLLIRFSVPAPIGEESRDFLSNTQQPIQIHLLAFLKAWVEHRTDDFASAEPGSPGALLRSFLASNLLHAFPIAVQHIQSRLNAATPSRMRLISSKSDAPAPPPAFTNIVFVNQPDLLDTLQGPEFFSVVSPLETARHLSGIVHPWYEQIREDEFFGLAWGKPGKELKSPNITKVTAYFNDFSDMVVTSILSQETVAARSKMIQWFISLADELDKLNNFHCLLSIVASLQKTEIYRLKMSWNQVPRLLYSRLREMLELVSSNYKILRLRTKTATPPFIPYIGVYLTDLTFIVDGMPTFNADGFVNWSKMQVITERISECLASVDARTNYHFEMFPPIVRWLTDFSRNMTTAEAESRSSIIGAQEEQELKIQLAQKQPSMTDSFTKLSK